MSRFARVKLSRRAVIGWAGALGATAALAACAAPAPTATPVPAAPAEAAKPTAAPAAAAPAKPATTGGIVFQTWATVNDNPGWEYLIKTYAQKKPDVPITLNTSPDNEYYQKLQTSIAGGATPDVAWFQGWEWQPYAAKGTLADIDALVARDKVTGPYPDYEGVKTHTLWKGKRYHLPMMIGVMLMFYAKKPFQDKGIPFPTDDWTMEQFLDTAQKLTDLSGAKKIYGYQANGSWFRDIHWLRSHGQNEFDNLVEPKTSKFNQPEIVELAQLFAQDVYHKLKISPTPADMQGGANSIESGNTAMKYEGGWFFPIVNGPKAQSEGKGVPFDVVLMPKGKDGTRRHRGWSEGLNFFNTPKLEQAWDFGKFAASEEAQIQWTEITGRVPNDPAIVEKHYIPRVQKTFGVENAKAFLTAFKSSMPDVIGEITRAKLWNEAVKPMGWDPLIGNSAKAAEVMPKVDAGVQKILDAHWKK